MATQTEFTAALEKIDTATSAAATAVTAIATKITNLEETIKGVGLTGAQEAELLAAIEGSGANLEALATSLEAMGKTETDPVPVPVPPAVEEPTPTDVPLSGRKKK